MDRIYDSEFTTFMDRFLKQHPQVAEDQMYRWHLDWDPKEIPPDQQDMEADLVSAAMD